jgi:hypothetical protein
MALSEFFGVRETQASALADPGLDPSDVRNLTSSLEITASGLCGISPAS